MAVWCCVRTNYVPFIKYDRSYFIRKETENRLAAFNLKKSVHRTRLYLPLLKKFTKKVQLKVPCKITQKDMKETMETITDKESMIIWIMDNQLIYWKYRFQNYANYDEIAIIKASKIYSWRISSGRVSIITKSRDIGNIERYCSIVVSFKSHKI